MKYLGLQLETRDFVALLVAAIACFVAEISGHGNPGVFLLAVGANVALVYLLAACLARFRVNRDRAKRQTQS